jgi:outer membrane protein
MTYRHPRFFRCFLFAICSLALIYIGSAEVLADDSGLIRIQSTEPLTLNQLLDAARTHNTDLQKARADLSVNRLLKLNAIGDFLPSLSVGYQISQSNYYSPTYTNPDGTVSSYPITTTEPTFYVDSLGYYRQGDYQTVTHDIPEGERRNSSLYISLQARLNLGGQEIYGLKNASKSVAINQLNLESAELEVEGSIRQQYYWVLAYQKLLELAERVLEQSRDQLELAQVRYEVGSVTELDVMQAEIDVGNQENEVMSAQNNLQTAREELNLLLGIDLSSEYPLVDEFRVEAPQYKLDELVERAQANRPDMKVSELSTEMYRNNVRQYRGSYFPDLTASISHSRSEQSGSNVDFTLDPRNRSTQYSLGLSWTLFDGFSREVSLQEARVAERQAKLDQVALNQTIEQSVRQSYYTLMRIWDQSQTTAKNRELGRRQLELEQELYRLGSASQLELRSAQVTYTQAETDHIYKTLEYLINLALLEEAVGGSLD